ncbi:hypothetical protein LZ30DRAFT_774598 [Colletotrichum cereale]|nr:hypothetical protein LZ30DRAFT_774598 [Colletotrichum cereale]
MDQIKNNDQTKKEDTKFELNDIEMACLSHHNEDFLVQENINMGFLVVRSEPAKCYVQFEASGGEDGLYKMSKMKLERIFTDGCCKKHCRNRGNGHINRFWQEYFSMVEHQGNYLGCCVLCVSLLPKPSLTNLGFVLRLIGTMFCLVIAIQDMLLSDLTSFNCLAWYQDKFRQLLGRE